MPIAYGVGLELSVPNTSEVKVGEARVSAPRYSSWQSSPFYDRSRINNPPDSRGVFINSAEERPEQTSRQFTPQKYPSDLQPLDNMIGKQQEGRRGYSEMINAYSPSQKAIPSKPAHGVYIQVEKTANSIYTPQYFKPSPNSNSKPHSDTSGEIRMPSSIERQAQKQRQGPLQMNGDNPRPKKLRRKNKKHQNQCHQLCEKCYKGGFDSWSFQELLLTYQKRPTYFSHDSSAVDSKANLQRNFANHIKPTLRHGETVTALFTYMDGNDDGVISIQELQNYLLLHNLISPDLPTSKHD